MGEITIVTVGGIKFWCALAPVRERKFLLEQKSLHQLTLVIRDWRQHGNMKLLGFKDTVPVDTSSMVLLRFSGIPGQIQKVSSR
jgi:hypothetical protein